MNNEIILLKNILKEAKFSLTEPRLEVFMILLNAKKPLRAAEISKRRKKANRASIYRTLNLFNELHITNIILRGWTPLVELSDKFQPHHHHITCMVCKKSELINSHKIEESLQEISNQKGYILKQHTVELYGICAKCQAKTDLA